MKNIQVFCYSNPAAEAELNKLKNVFVCTSGNIRNLPVIIDDTDGEVFEWVYFL